MSFFSQPTIPTSSDYTVIIPFNSSQGKFDREAYSPAMTGGRASAEEIDQVLKLIETVASGISTPDQFLKSWCLRFVLPFILMVCFQLNGSFWYSPRIFWVWFTVYVIGGNIWMCLVTAKNNSKTKENVKSVLKLYQDAFQKKGLRWYVPVNFPLYVELFKEYREQQVHHQVNIPIYQPVSVENHETATMAQPFLQK